MKPDEQLLTEQQYIEAHEQGFRDGIEYAQHVTGSLVLVCPPPDHERAEGFAANDDAISDVIADPNCPPGKWFIVSLGYYESHFGTLRVD